MMDEQKCAYCGGIFPYPVELNHHESECVAGKYLRRAAPWGGIMSERMKRLLRFLPHGCSPTWDHDEGCWKPCPRCGLVRFLHG